MGWFWQVWMIKECLKPGDRVACAGVDYASHAEIVSVPQNLVVKIPDNVDSKDAAFTTLGAIAMQGLRQADPKIGEKICVIGLGLLGQITTQLLRSSGCRVLGIDLSPTFISIAKEHSVDEAILRNDPDLVNKCDNFTNGRGFDAVIITAATNSNDPITLAGELARKKGKVVVVGVVPMDIPRDPHYYRKELDIKMSCSYGPGRYDVEYENNGNDYPYSYVRWTEQRNMESFLDMLAANRLNLLPLTTHIINITEAKDAYDIILGKVKEHHIGILLQYSVNNGKYESIVELARKPVSIINTGFIGAGSFAQSYLIPNVKSLGCSLDTVVTSRGITSRSVASKFGFNNCSSDINDIINNKSINTVFIATPHSFHAKQVEDALRAGKNVFVEKPLALNIEELNEVKEAMKSSSLTLMVGFNRRFAPVCTKIKEEFIGISEPKSY